MWREKLPLAKPRAVPPSVMKRELPFQQVIYYMSFRWVNILHAWTVNFVNKVLKNPKHITAITCSSKPNIYPSASQASIVWHLWWRWVWMQRLLQQCKHQATHSWWVLCTMSCLTQNIRLADPDALYVVIDKILFQCLSLKCHTVKNIGYSNALKM